MILPFTFVSIPHIFFGRECRNIIWFSKFILDSVTIRTGNQKDFCKVAVDLTNAFFD